jgi:hydroxyacylglutathione hydrolase
MTAYQIHTIRAGLSQAFMIEDDLGFYLIDAGTPGYERRFLDRLRTRPGKDLRLIFLTHAHFDHYGCALKLCEATRAPVLIHAADAGALGEGQTQLGSVRGRGRLVRPVLPLAELFFNPRGVEADHMLADGERLDAFGLPATVLHTPGHTPGSATLLLDNGDAFAGDLLSTTGKPHAQRYFAWDWALVGTSLRKLQYYRPERVFVGHGGRPIQAIELAAL